MYLQESDPIESGKKRKLRTLRRDLTSVRNEFHWSFIDLNHICNSFMIGNDKAILKHKQIQNIHLITLETRLENCSCDPDKVIFNFSNYKLTESEKSVLSKDLKFAIPPSRLEHAGFMLLFELLFCDIKSNNLSIPLAVKSKFLVTTFSSFDSFNSSKIKSNLSKEELKALHNLRKQKHLVIRNADKGNTAVITKKNAYINNMK